MRVRPVLKTARLITRRKACPCCASRTDRVRTPVSLRWLKALIGPRMSVRRCYACRRWKGITVERPAPSAPPGPPPTSSRPGEAPIDPEHGRAEMAAASDRV